MGVANDQHPLWSPATRDALRKADAAIDRIAGALDEPDEASVVRDVGEVLIGCVAAVCSEIASLTAAIEEHSP